MRFLLWNYDSKKSSIHEPLSAPLEPPHPVIGETIKFLRTKAGLTQEEVGLEGGIHPTEISRLEKGMRNPKWETMKRLAKGLGVPCSQMVEIAEELELERESA